jgi:hypothetical protein
MISQLNPCSSVNSIRDWRKKVIGNNIADKFLFRRQMLGADFAVAAGSKETGTAHRGCF